MDPGGVHLRGVSEPSGLGHVCLCLLLRHDLHLVGGVRLWDPLQLGWLGNRSKSDGVETDLAL